MDNQKLQKWFNPAREFNLVLELDFLGGARTPLMIPKKPKRRSSPIAVAHGNGKLVVGTTDTLREKPKLWTWKLYRKKIDFVLETASG